MISTNLSTRPFYNERLVRTILVAAGAIVLAVTALNAWTIVTLSRKDAVQNVQSVRAEKKAAEARRAAGRIRRSIDANQLAAVTTAAAEANRLISARTFSWTDLLSEFEQTLPPDVRITNIAPTVDRDGRLLIDIVVIARRVEDVNDFVEKLEAKGGFSDVVPRQESLNNEGLREITLVGRYVGHRGAATP